LIDFFKLWRFYRHKAGHAGQKEGLKAGMRLDKEQNELKTVSLAKKAGSDTPA